MEKQIKLGKILLKEHFLFLHLVIINEFPKCLHLDLEVKAVFTPTSMVSFRSARKIKDYIVRAKPYPLERYVGSRKCSKSRCEGVIILKVQISFLAQLLVKHIKSIITLTVIVNV